MFYVHHVNVNFKIFKLLTLLVPRPILLYFCIPFINLFYLSEFSLYNKKQKVAKISLGFFLFGPIGISIYLWFKHSKLSGLTYTERAKLVFTFIIIILIYKSMTIVV